jgi:hypothetical protein
MDPMSVGAKEWESGEMPEGGEALSADACEMIKKTVDDEVSFSGKHGVILTLDAAGIAKLAGRIKALRAHRTGHAAEVARLHAEMKAMGAKVYRRWDTFLGFYVGEVIVRQYGGIWIRREGECIAVPARERLGEFRRDRALRRAMKKVVEVTESF